MGATWEVATGVLSVFALIDGFEIEIDALTKNHGVAWSARTGRVGGIENRAVVTDVVKQSVTHRRAASHQGQKAREGIREGRRARVGVRDAVA